MKSLVLINFKNYPEAMGKKAVRLARMIASLKSKKFILIVSPSELDLEEVVKVPLTVYAQHVDPILEGAHTGSISIKELKMLGVKGTILNHSERKLTAEVLSKTVELCRKHRLKTIVCASTISEAKKVSRFQPDYIAYEPKELIGGEVSVTSAKPQLIKDVVVAVKHISPATKILCGAGIHSSDDVKKALEFGAQGILIAHAIVKAKEPKRFLSSLLFVK